MTPVPMSRARDLEIDTLVIQTIQRYTSGACEMRCGIGRMAKSFTGNVLLATGVNDISSQVVLHKEATGSGVISMYNDPNQPPYGQPPQQPSDVPPTQYAP